MSIQKFQCDICHKLITELPAAHRCRKCGILSCHSCLEVYGYSKWDGNPNKLEHGFFVDEKSFHVFYCKLCNTFLTRNQNRVRSLLEDHVSKVHPEYLCNSHKNISYHEFGIYLKCPDCKYEYVENEDMYLGCPNNGCIMFKEKDPYHRGLRYHYEYPSKFYDHITNIHHMVVCIRCHEILKDRGQQLDHILSNKNCCDSMISKHHGILLVMIMKNIQHIQRSLSQQRKHDKKYRQSSNQKRKKN